MDESNGLDAILEAELALLADAGAMQERVKEAVESRAWAGFEAYTRKLEELGARMDALEGKRLAAQDGATPHTAALKRRLRAEVNKIRWTSEAVARYIGEQRLLAGAFIEAVYPEKRGAVYSRRGKREAADMRRLVLDEAY
jgi:hypothetical protein